VSESGIIATPHSVIRNEGDAVEKVARVGSELEADLYVVGIARRAMTAAGEERFRTFADALRQKTCKAVVLWDETLTTVEASNQLRAAGRSRRDAEREIDMHAAAVILQSYLDAQSRRTP
jgi:putative Holliday junction resolvase